MLGGLYPYGSCGVAVRWFEAGPCQYSAGPHARFTRCPKLTDDAATTAEGIPIVRHCCSISHTEPTRHHSTPLASTLQRNIRSQPHQSLRF